MKVQSIPVRSVHLSQEFLNCDPGAKSSLLQDFIRPAATFLLEHLLLFEAFFLLITLYIISQFKQFVSLRIDNYHISL